MRENVKVLFYSNHKPQLNHYIRSNKIKRRNVVSALYVGNMTILLSQFIRVRDIRYALILHICQL